MNHYRPLATSEKILKFKMKFVTFDQHVRCSSILILPNVLLDTSFWSLSGSIVTLENWSRKIRANEMRDLRHPGMELPCTCDLRKIIILTNSEITLCLTLQIRPRRKMTCLLMKIGIRWIAKVFRRCCLVQAQSARHNRRQFIAWKHFLDRLSCIV